MEDTDHDQQEKEVEDGSSVPTQRSYYGCTICKRGFTNAQALGGHMNIHRKDRVKKGKQVDAISSISTPNNVSNNEESTSSPFISKGSGQPTTSYYYPIFQAQKNLYHNPRNYPPSLYAFQYEFLNPTSQSLNVNQELLGANLSLQISPTHLEDNGEVDLELRLGHDP